jgi:hypothetical protein
MVEPHHPKLNLIVPVNPLRPAPMRAVDIGARGGHFTERSEAEIPVCQSVRVRFHLPT